jgi:hypothetical protein
MIENAEVTPYAWNRVGRETARMVARSRTTPARIWAVGTRALLAAAIVVAGTTYSGEAQTATSTFIPYADAKPIVQRLRASLPADLATIPEAELDTAWNAWVSRLDRDIRARLDRGDEDSAINFLLFGTTFTTLPRALNDSARIGGPERAAEIVRGRIADLTAAIASPGTNERLIFVRDLVSRHGIDPTTADGREQARVYFRTLMTRITGEVDAYARTIQSARESAELAARSTLFRTRGLSSDTSIRPDFAVDLALGSLASNGTLRSGAVRRIGVIGPGLDFTDKAEGYDFYPQQTTQPFSVIDSVLRLGLAHAGDLHLAAFDVSPRVNAHLGAARQRARDGIGYPIVLPHDREDRWRPGLNAFWKSFGQRIGQDAGAAARRPNGTTATRPPDGVDVRAVRVRPDVVLSIEPHDVNVVVQRVAAADDNERFDLIVATNVLVYYSVFEQSLALANLASMLRPGGVLLSNNVLVELPTTPLHAIGHSTAIYSDRPDDRDEIIWYVRR